MTGGRGKRAEEENRKIQKDEVKKEKGRVNI